MKYMQGIFHDWQAKNITSVLHEKRGGYANNMASLRRPRGEGDGARRRDRRGRHRDRLRAGNGTRPSQPSRPSAGTIACDEVVVAVGPWINTIWNMLDLPKAISIKGRDGKVHDGVPMWHYMALQEGTLGVDPNFQKTNAGAMPPVIHVDTDAPLYSDRDGALITDKLWGIYYKPDFNFGGVQGGAMPGVGRSRRRGRARRSLRAQVAGVRRHRQLRATCGRRRSRTARSASRAGTRLYKQGAVRGHRLLHAGQLPGVRRFRDNVYVIADSNHGYKMIGVGELVADELLGEQARAARAVPFLALRRGQPASGQQQPVSLELTGGGRTFAVFDLPRLPRTFSIGNGGRSWRRGFQTR